MICACLSSGLICLDCAMANARLAAASSKGGGHRYYVATVLAHAAEKHGVLPSHILSNSKHKHVVAARRDAALAFRADGMEYKPISHVLRRDRSTVYTLIHGKKAGRPVVQP